MNTITSVFVLSLLVFFFTHSLYFFNLNWQSRKTIYFVNLLTLWVYFAFTIYYLLSFRIKVFLSHDQHILFLGGIFLVIFTITDFFTGSKSLGLIFSILVLLLGTTGVVNIHYKEVIYALPDKGEIRLIHFLVFLDQLGAGFFFIAVLLSILYHYSFIEVKYHHRFFFSNRFPGFHRLWHYIDYYLLSGCILSVISLFFSLKIEGEQGIGSLTGKLTGGVTIIYYLLLLYIRYRKGFSSRINLYWMLLSLIFLLIKAGYWR